MICLDRACRKIVGFVFFICGSINLNTETEICSNKVDSGAKEICSMFMYFGDLNLLQNFTFLDQLTC